MMLQKPGIDAIILPGLLILVTSCFLSWVVIRLSVKLNILDIPNNRSSHIKPTPRGGGIAVVLSWYAGITWLFIMHLISDNLYYALLSGLILALISFLDDLRDLRPAIRLIGQCITAILAMWFLDGLNLNFSEFWRLPDFIIYPVTIVGFVWFINLFNFLDGIDGYASIEALCVAFALYLLTGDSLNVILMAAVTGFLIWNWPKARIFMGDVGSTQLGFILFVLGIHYHNLNKLTIFCWIIITLPFWFDATITLLRRWRNKEKLSQAHRKHVYQRLVQSGYSHLRVDILLVILNAVLIIPVFYFHKSTTAMIITMLAALLILYGITRFTDRRFPFPSN